MSPATTIPTETPELAVRREADGRLTVLTLELDGLHEVGSFASPGAAWAAIDALDAPLG